MANHRLEPRRRFARAPRFLAFLALAAASTAYAAGSDQAVTACGACHGLTVNSVPVVPGTGSFGFTANVKDRPLAAWQATIDRMIRNGASVVDPAGLAVYLAALGAPPAATATATVPPTTTATPRIERTPRSTATPRRRHRPRPMNRPRPGRPGRSTTPTRSMTSAPTTTPTATATATATATVASAESRGRTLYESNCVFCHDPGSAGFVGETIDGEPARDIAEAIREVPEMQFLGQVLVRGDVEALAAYLAILDEPDEPDDDY